MTPYGRALFHFRFLFQTGQGTIPSGSLFHYSHWWPHGVSVYISDSDIVVMHSNDTERVFRVTEAAIAVDYVRLLVQ